MTSHLVGINQALDFMNVRKFQPQWGTFRDYI